MTKNRSFSDVNPQQLITEFASKKSSKETLGAPLCPCRHYENKELEVCRCGAVRSADVFDEWISCF